MHYCSQKSRICATEPNQTELNQIYMRPNADTPTVIIKIISEILRILKAATATTNDALLGFTKQAGLSPMTLAFDLAMLFHGFPFLIHT